MQNYEIKIVSSSIHNLVRSQYVIQDPNDPEYEKYQTVSKGTSEQIDAFLSEGHRLFKIQRIGTGKETRYNIMPSAS